MRGELFLILVVLLIIGCMYVEKQQGDIQLFTEPKEEHVVYKSQTDSTTNQTEVDSMKLTSAEFSQGQEIPSEFTCDDADINPPLVISNVPKNAKSLALIMDDPDAPRGTFVHWIVWNILPDTKELKKGEEIMYPQGRNDFGNKGYGGPCPPGGTHRYFFKLYALDTKLDLEPGATKKDLERAMQGHIIEKVELMGTYTR